MNSAADRALLEPQFADIRRAAERIAAHAQRTPVLRSASLDALVGAELVFKCENFQRVGAFKFRGACNAVFGLDEALAAKGVVTHSSGNHGAALALAARLRGIPAHVVVPHNAARSKVAAIAAYGARIVPCAPTIAAREAAAAELMAETGAEMVHPYNDGRVIAGQGTAALELIEAAGALDGVIAPVGGGGLLSGCAIATRALLPQARIFGAEPEQAADAHASLLRGERVTDMTADTIADGLRGQLGTLTFTLLQRHSAEILLASEVEIVAAMRLLWERLKIVIEPSSALPLAVLLRHRERVQGMRIGVILTGGNIDLDRLPW